MNSEHRKLDPSWYLARWKSCDTIAGCPPPQFPNHGAYLKQQLQTLPGVTDESVLATLTPASIAQARKRKTRIA